MEEMSQKKHTNMYLLALDNKNNFMQIFGQIIIIFYWILVYWEVE